MNVEEFPSFLLDSKTQKKLSGNSIAASVFPCSRMSSTRIDFIQTLKAHSHGGGKWFRVLCKEMLDDEKVQPFSQNVIHESTPRAEHGQPAAKAAALYDDDDCVAYDLNMKLNSN